MGGLDHHILGQRVALGTGASYRLRSTEANSQARCTPGPLQAWGSHAWKSLSAVAFLAPVTSQPRSLVALNLSWDFRHSVDATSSSASYSSNYCFSLWHGSFPLVKGRFWGLFSFQATTRGAKQTENCRHSEATIDFRAALDPPQPTGYPPPHFLLGFALPTTVRTSTGDLDKRTVSVSSRSI